MSTKEVQKALADFDLHHDGRVNDAELRKSLNVSGAKVSELTTSKDGVNGLLIHVLLSTPN